MAGIREAALLMTKHNRINNRVSRESTGLSHTIILLLSQLLSDPRLMPLMDGGPPLDTGEISCMVMCADSGDLLRSVDIFGRESWKEQAVKKVFCSLV